MIVLDSNMLVSAFGAHGLCETIMLACLEHHDLIVSEHILREVQVALAGKFKMPSEQVAGILQFLRRRCRSVQPAHVVDSVCRDQKDLDVLGAADAVGATCLVTGDQDLLVLREYKDIPILSPRAFYEVLGRQK